MKYLKKFEHFSGQDLGRFSEEDEMEMDDMEMDDMDEMENEMDDDMHMYDDEMMYNNMDDEMSDDDTFEDEREEEKGRIWGDEVVESRKSKKKSKPDFLDLDKDGDKKESMKKAAKDAKGSKKEDKGGKGLSAAQKKLPDGLRKAIEARKKK
jgi:hypothetical protein